MGLLEVFEKKPPSGNVAKSRLQMVLFHDRLSISPQILELLKVDIIKVISNYMEIDQDGLDIKISMNNQKRSSADETPVLTADIPIKSWKKR